MHMLYEDDLTQNKAEGKKITIASSSPDTNASLS